MSLRRSLSVLTISSLALVLETMAFAAPPEASPETQTLDAKTLDEARVHYQRGVALYNEGDFKLAVIEFQRSYELTHTNRLLYNIAQVHFQLSNYAAAMRAYEKYLAGGGSDITPERRAEVEKSISDLRVRTALVTITTNTEDAEIFVDNVSLGKSPLAPWQLVDAGSHRFSASKPGWSTASKTVVLVGSDRATLSLELQEERKAEQVATAGPPPNYVWVGWVATGALAAGAITTGVLSLSASSAYDDALNDPSQADSVDSKRTKLKTLSAVTDVLIASTIVVGGVTLYFTLKKKPDAKKTAVDNDLGLRFGTGRLDLVGTF